MAEMTKEWLKKHCKAERQYQLPELNDKLFLHFKGFGCIQNLEEYTGLKALFLEGNGIDTIEGLDTLAELKCLYLQQNCIGELEGLDHNLQLSTLNLSNNNISKIENVDHLPDLHTLQLANNSLKTADSIRHITSCPKLGVLDLSNNKLDGDPEEFLNIFSNTPDLGVLYLSGNPIVQNIRHYRKTMIARCKKLTYLDDRPVFENERYCCEAWLKGGLEAEREERERLKQVKKEQDEKNYQYIKAIRDRGLAKQAALKAAKAAKEGKEPTELDDDDDDDDVDSDVSDIEDDIEPAELTAARRMLAQYPARAGEEEPKELSKARQEVTDKRGSKPGTWQPLYDGDENIPTPNADSTSLNSDLNNSKAASKQSVSGGRVPIIEEINPETVLVEQLENIQANVDGRAKMETSPSEDAEVDLDDLPKESLDLSTSKLSESLDDLPPLECIDGQDELDGLD
mmetsp:Transcript_29637/g.35998  ORF Transcript_29637/g.35998 Transcript_29637/m.35998 type:complete len:456 (+) Transcript_29637:140-1507(+)|eukprot:CAMPEP_0197849200 /NCGR_PEP_ID=MMETSP1438-20131217/11234_1 /TAXON_ID=1461541 /ORGANISM="Pterosperma sp., Strain CCMP1384" /LENGTH=455 /DNA_ID=CAMNT_0043461771 /DNA_START=140 /DNA_END=1507 /DNA_ORIENTATION=+